MYCNTQTVDYRRAESLAMKEDELNDPSKKL